MTYLACLLKVVEVERLIAPEYEWWVASLDQEWSKTNELWQWDDCMREAPYRTLETGNINERFS